MSVLVTGAAGSIGANLCRTLCEHADTVAATFDSLPIRDLDGVRSEFIGGDILDRVRVPGSSS